MAALRGRRSRRGIHGRPKGIERHAAQAQSDPEREPRGARAPRPHERDPGARERGVVARARHLAFVRGAHDRARCDDDARVHARSREDPRRWVGSVSEKMQRNLDSAGELYFSEGVMLALVERGLARQDAYVIVQRNAMKAFAGKGTFRANLKSDAELTKLLDAKALSRCFDLRHALQHVPAILRRAFASNEAPPDSRVRLGPTKKHARGGRRPIARRRAR